ncbi:hypothetical protein [Clostridium tagluense]|uniref:Putative DNA-binding protein n=1 Tax=Clostridium tagluense TaxID=360422 RepID=A0A401UUL0_9CLOT|nr:hypothetical protein [Clostridium tagluense]GCD13249.1 putative DNA-binding protein [Clostridium tagluense]
MIKEDFNKLEVLEQLEYINKELLKDKSLRIISSDLKMSKTTFRDRFIKIGYIYNAETKQYYRDKTITLQHQITLEEHARTIEQATEPIDKVIQKDNKSISEVAIIKNQNNVSMELQEFAELKTTLAEVKELIEMKEQLKEVILLYNKNINIIDVPELQELKIDKSKFDGDLKGRLIKVYDNVNDAWIEFCKSNNQFKMQDLYSIALLECIEKYKK